jgi:hypothetical protein
MQAFGLILWGFLRFYLALFYFLLHANVTISTVCELISKP